MRMQEMGFTGIPRSSLFAIRQSCNPKRFSKERKANHGRRVAFRLLVSLPLRDTLVSPAKTGSSFFSMPTQHFGQKQAYVLG